MLRASLTLLAASMLGACGAQSATVVDDRAVYIDTIADTYCREKDSCGEIGADDASYENMDDCQDDVEGFMRDVWPADTCGDDAIDGDLFLDCDDRARLIACDGGLVDAISTLSECNADEVCVD